MSDAGKPAAANSATAAAAGPRNGARRVSADVAVHAPGSVDAALAEIADPAASALDAVNAVGAVNAVNVTPAANAPNAANAATAANAAPDRTKLPAVSAVTVRPTTLQDWPLLKAVRLAALADAPTAFGVSHAEALANPDQQWMARAAGTGPGRFFLAFQRERAIGMAASVAQDNARASLIAMWVDPAARGLGAADRLIDAVKAHAAAQGVDEVILEVAPDNTRAVDFYKRHGFAFQSYRERLASHPDIELQRMGTRLAPDVPDVPDVADVADVAENGSTAGLDGTRGTAVPAATPTRL